MSVFPLAITDYTSLLQALPGGVVALAPDGTVALLNPAAESLWGVPKEAVLERRPAAVLPAVLPPELLQALGEPSTSGDYWLPHTAQWITMRITPASDGYMWVYWDNITAQRQAQAEAQHHREAERSTQQLIASIEEIAHTGHYEAELASTRLHFSDGLFRLFGEAPQAFEPTLDLINSRSHPDDAAVVSQVLAEAVRTRNPYYYQRRIFRADGQMRIVEAHGNVVCDPSGTPIKLLGLVQDVTDRVQAEAETLQLKDELAQRATDAYRTLFNSIDEGFILIDLLFDGAGKAVDGRFLEANRVLEQQTGLTDIVGKTLLEVLPDMGPALVAQYEHVAQTGEPARFEVQIDSLNRSWYTLYASRVGEASSRQIAVVFDNITARKQQEQYQAYLLRLNDALRPLQDPVAIQEAAARMLGEQLQADRALYAEVNPNDETYTIASSYAHGSYPQLQGHLAIREFGEVSRRLRTGQTVVIEDLLADETLGEETQAALVAVNISAAIIFSLVKAGQWVAAFGVHHGQPRRWNAGEIAMVEETAERTWAAVERARAEAALRASEARLRTLIDNLPGGAAFIVGRDFRYQLAAGESLHQLGITPDNYVGRTLAEVLPPEKVADYLPFYQQALAGQPFVHEHGAYGRTFVSRGMPLPDASGEIPAVLVISYDITDRKQAEDALRQSEKRLRIALEAAELGAWDWDLATDEVHWNERHFVLMGLDPVLRPMKYSYLEQHLHADDRPIVMQKLQAAKDEQQVFRAEFRIITPQGEVRWMSGYGQVTDTTPDGQPLRISGVMLDITERKHTEQQLQELATSLERKVARRTESLQQSRDLLQSVYDTSLIGMSVVHAVRDAAGNIEDFVFLSVNRKLEEETDHHNLVGMRYTEAFPGIVPSGLYEQMVRVVETGKSQQTEYFYPYEGMEHWFCSMYVKLGDGLVVTTLDITERKQVEAERDQQFMLLQQAEIIARLGSWEYELATGAFRWSEGMYRLFDLPVGSPVRPSLYLDYAAAEDRPVAERLVRYVTQEPRSFEKTLRLHIGEQVKTIRVRAVVLYDSQNQPQRLLGVDLDLSEVQRLQADNLRLRLQQQQALFEAVQQAQEAERKRIAESLHNGIGQLLYATKLRLDQLHAPVLRGTSLVAARHEADGLLAEAIQQTRALSHELVPMVLEEFGLVAALQDICHQLRTPRLRFRCSVQLEVDLDAMTPSLQLALYRIAQELMQNVVKHAHGATEASLELETVPGFVMLRVEDDGPGFISAATSPGLGLRSIRDRVALLGGTLDLGSSPQSGAYVRLRLPVPSTRPVLSNA
ncbi:PAS domain-containing protein [Hymenobacter sp. GOD-10R]|uniref:PAS domain-containing protein n=1 Tax=Hymenobacter sp. GOD-10R TaxID=3093922 RepID=UPI002D769046|nr:PAS domain-containing protein [Hymenobacter sp. GOD-10R]WRQ26958.1 PAS domain-containing protein [Hymenobacter sp. GOD-10R]